jgi:hypothetical protein
VFHSMSGRLPGATDLLPAWSCASALKAFERPTPNIQRRHLSVGRWVFDVRSSTAFRKLFLPACKRATHAAHRYYRQQA